MQMHRLCSLKIFTMKSFVIIPSLVIISGFVRTETIFSEWFRPTALDNKLTPYGHGLTSRSLIHCVHACAANATCQSVFFIQDKKQQGNCIIQSTILFPGLPCLVDELGSVYYIKENGCPHGWLSHLGSCYYFDDRLVDFQHAEHVCLLLGGYVVHVGTPAENEFLTNYLLTHITNESSTDPLSQGVWLGMTKQIDSTGNAGYTWTWLDDGSVAAFTNWWSGEPNGGVGEPCAVFHGGDIKHLWADVSCTRTFRTFCEKR